MAATTTTAGTATAATKPLAGALPSERELELELMVRERDEHLVSLAVSLDISRIHFGAGRDETDRVALRA